MIDTFFKSIIADNPLFLQYKTHKLMFYSINAYTGKEEASFEPLNDTQLIQKLDAAEQAFPQWKALTFTQRAAYLKAAANVFRTDKTTN